MTECYECSKLAELRAENNALRVKVDEPANGNDGETTVITQGDVDALMRVVERDYVFKGTIGDWLKAFQLEHGDDEMSLLDPATLKDLWTAIADDIPLGYEASKRLADWLRVAEITLERDYVRRAVYDSLKELTTNSDKWLKGKLEDARAERDELRAAYDELTGIAAQLCRACGFSMVDASGEVVG